VVHGARCCVNGIVYVVHHSPAGHPQDCKSFAIVLQRAQLKPSRLQWSSGLRAASPFRRKRGSSLRGVT